MQSSKVRNPELATLLKIHDVERTPHQWNMLAKRYIDRRKMTQAVSQREIDAMERLLSEQREARKIEIDKLMAEHRGASAAHRGTHSTGAFR